MTNKGNYISFHSVGYSKENQSCLSFCKSSDISSSLGKSNFFSERNQSLLGGSHVLFVYFFSKIIFSKNGLTNKRL